MDERCALCLQEQPLQESHLIPKFVGKWLKEKGTGYLANAADGSNRVQDLVKIKLLCKDCEQKFSQIENYFANNMFYPFVNDKIQEFDYDENLKPLIISMAWRCLQPIKEDFIKQNPTSQVISFVEQAEKDWREFLNDEGTSINSYETHVLFLDYVKPESTLEVDPKFHWYLLHGTDSTIVYNNTKVYFYVKLPWMICIISIEPKKLEGWEGTMINKNGHITASGQTVKDPGFAQFLQDRAKFALYSSQGPSQEVATKRLVKSIKKDPEKYLTSNIYESWIVERDILRKKKMENMPESLIELVEEAILDGKTGSDVKLVDSQVGKLISRRIADRIADLSKEEAKRLHEMIFAVNNMARILNKNKEGTFTTDSLHITYMVSFDKDQVIRAENVKKEMGKLKEGTQDKMHCAVFSFSPLINNYQSAYFVPSEEFSEKKRNE